MTPPDNNWESRMTPAECQWCWNRISDKLNEQDYGKCVDSFRAARAWKGSQVKRFKRIRSCCGSEEWVAYRWNWRKFRFDKYILGFNYGH
jgi:hypothetical protein